MRNIPHAVANSSLVNARETTTRTVEPMAGSYIAAACAFWLDVDRAVRGLDGRPHDRRDEAGAVLRAFAGL